MIHMSQQLLVDKTVSLIQNIVQKQILVLDVQTLHYFVEITTQNWVGFFLVQKGEE